LPFTNQDYNMAVVLCIAVTIQRPRGRTGHMGPSPKCCMKASKHAINEPVTACFEQKKNTFWSCRVHAYIFRTLSTNEECADPGAWWIPRRLKRLQQVSPISQPVHNIAISVFIFIFLFNFYQLSLTNILDGFLS
uniref:Chemokine interleukin-8-like domain-containing protein n=1 Tax=Sparus aurata TaxID=8175 RepID=A0A671Y8K1_SPAAU